LLNFIYQSQFFPGKSTLDQIARIVEVTNMPSNEILEKMGSDYAVRMMNSIRRVMPRSLEAMFPDCDADTIDIMAKCLQFSPDKRITIEELLDHPYVAGFRERDEEITSEGPVVIPIDDGDKRPVEVYKEELYKLMGPSQPAGTEEKKKKRREKSRSKSKRKKKKE